MTTAFDGPPLEIDTRPAVLDQFTVDETGRAGHRPRGVAAPADADEVAALVRWARTTRTPLIARGAGTSLEGHLLAQHDELIVDLSQANSILDISPADFTATVQPGVTRTRLNSATAEYGLQFTVDPGADASLGGMAATNASGTTTVRYGGMRANVLALQAVLPDATVARFGRAVRKSSSGYDLKDLLIGSAGTLGIITELTVRLHPIPEWLRSLRISFPTVTDAVDAAVEMLGAALPVSRLELVDAVSMVATNAYRGTDYAETPALFIDVESSSEPAAIAEEAEITRIDRGHNALDIAAARTHTERYALWEDRHNLFFALKSLHPGRRFMVTDTAVPYSRLAAAVDTALRLGTELGLAVSVCGHIGDGNVHTIVPYDEHDDEVVQQYSDRLVRHALSVGGTATGEHGIGLTKKKYLREEHGAAVDLMLAIKRTLDPLNLFNPGKVLDP
ncbi:FAD-binding oxidoreductase [Nocardia brasiliensis]|uniref:D-lactate dehydrogenase (cytochrome) n=1 Tax=Nocardia brasiliensis (strain ATCC 700358 / HUJEG-1) TaxID=1133849 RepID=K0F409_NOCB7|nr:FAD-binding oxidoreductase [Nocardia brasiliensis]AFU02306.1 FAD linked oxidase domain-containing protein [Nocardia brasiliensis ATCC 700358]